MNTEPKPGLYTPLSFETPILDRTEQFLSSLPIDGTPVPIITRSKIGEELFVALKIKPYQGKRNLVLEEYLGGEIDQLLTVVTYSRGNGLIYENGKLGIVGHRDLAICKAADGTRFVYTDYKTDDYLPPDQSNFDLYSTEFFSPASSQTIERRVCDLENAKHLFPKDSARRAKIIEEIKKHGEIYRVGIGSLMQAVTVDRLLRLGIRKVISGNISEEGARMWNIFGVTASPSQNISYIDVETAKNKIREVISSHIS